MKEFCYKGLVFEPYRLFKEGEACNIAGRIKLWETPVEEFSHEDFYREAEASGGKENVVDLYKCNDVILLPCTGGLMCYSDPDMPEHYLREKSKTMPSSSLMSLISVIDGAGTKELYPTPKDLVHEMVAGIDWNHIGTVLEPSAGTGELVSHMLEWREIARTCRCSKELDVDCIEINPDLRAMLKGKGYRIVHDDFMTFGSAKHYDLIVMNPPFSCADKHLMRALDIQRHGGKVICLLNAETIRHPSTALQKTLRSRLTELDAHITYYEEAFADASRPTNVTIAMVKVTVPEEEIGESEIYQRLKKASEINETVAEVTDMAPTDPTECYVRMFNVEVAAGLELIRQYNALVPHILPNLTDFERKEYGAQPTLVLTTGGSQDTVSANDYLRLTRKKYWGALMNNPEFTGKLTSNLKETYCNKVNELANYDFTPFNIRQVLVEMNAELYSGAETTIMALFDTLTNKHAWWDKEDNANIHYYNGWAHNKAHAIANKVVLPAYGVIPDYSWVHDTFSTYKAYERLVDIEKCFNYLDGHLTRNVDLMNVLGDANSAGKTRNIECKYFTVTFFKKGTMHLKFRDEKLLEKFNIYCSKKRNWLPPDYGTKRYEDMSTEAKEVIDSFQGKEAYENVMANAEYYLPATQSLLSLPEAG